MKYKEGPWWIPILLMAAFLGAVVTMPRQTGAAVHAILHGGVAALQSAAGGGDTTDGNPQPISIRLPAVPGSAQDGPPTSWNN